MAIIKFWFKRQNKLIKKIHTVFDFCKYVLCWLSILWICKFNYADYQFISHLSRLEIFFLFLIYSYAKEHSFKVGDQVQGQSIKKQKMDVVARMGRLIISRYGSHIQLQMYMRFDFWFLLSSLFNSHIFSCVFDRNKF